MDITINAPKAVVQNGMGFFDLFLGADKFSEVRNGEAVTITATDGTVEGTVSSVQIGVLGQFLGAGVPHVTNLGRAQDVRNIVDALEARAPKTKGVVDPRTLYTAVYVTVPYAAPTPVAGVMPA